MFSRLVHLTGTGVGGRFPLRLLHASFLFTKNIAAQYFEILVQNHIIKGQWRLERFQLSFIMTRIPFKGRQRIKTQNTATAFIANNSLLKQLVWQTNVSRMYHRAHQPYIIWSGIPLPRPLIYIMELDIYHSVSSVHLTRNPIKLIFCGWRSLEEECLENSRLFRWHIFLPTAHLVKSIF